MNIRDRLKFEDIEETEKLMIQCRNHNRDNTCDYCGTQLTDSGECPRCDLGEEDTLEDEV